MPTEMLRAVVSYGRIVQSGRWSVYVLRGMTDFPIARTDTEEEARDLAERLAGATGWPVEKEQ